jgi:hypothetical protein
VPAIEGTIYSITRIEEGDEVTVGRHSAKRSTESARWKCEVLIDLNIVNTSRQPQWIKGMKVALRIGGARRAFQLLDCPKPTTFKKNFDHLPLCEAFPFMLDSGEARHGYIYAASANIDPQEIGAYGWEISVINADGKEYELNTTPSTSDWSGRDMTS